MAKFNKQKYAKLLFSSKGLIVVLGIIFYPQIKKIVLLIKATINGVSDFFISPETAKKREIMQGWLDDLEKTINYKNLNAQNHDLVAITLYEYFDHLGTSNLDVISDTFLNDIGTVDDIKLTIVKYGIKTTHIFFFDDCMGTLVSHINSELSGELKTNILNRLIDLQII